MSRSIGLLSALVLFWTASSASAWQNSAENCMYAMAADGSSHWELMTFEEFAEVGSPDISPDGRKVAVDGFKLGENRGSSRILVADLESGEVHDLCSGAMPTWSPDGSLLAFSRRPSGVWIRSATGAEEKLIDGSGWGVQWSPDGKKLAYARKGQLIIYDVLTDTKKEVFPQNAMPYAQIGSNSTWSPDSTRVCFKGIKPPRSYELAIVTVTGDTPDVKVLAAGDEMSGDIAWHPDGTRIIVPHNNGRLMVYRPDGSEPAQELKGQPTDRTNGNVNWSRDGKVLLFMSNK